MWAHFCGHSPQKPGYPLQLQAAARRPLGYRKARSALVGIFAAGRNAKLKNPQGCGFLSQFRFYPLRGSKTDIHVGF
ncbi:MAG: hypothetical protein LBD20_10320 [Spirochaetaceae bacterium]|jgi:lipase chaperone LimK|nr:hypothetical protein [Spirochaetaceae bacterium]